MQEDIKGSSQVLVVYLLLLQGRQGSVNHAIAKHIGRAPAGARAENAEKVYTGQNGVEIILFLHQILNKPKLLEKNLRKRGKARRRRRKFTKFLLDLTINDSVWLLA